MKKLIIITGVSGVGKSTIAKALHEKIQNSTLLSFDVLIESIYDIVGFKDISQKNSLRIINRKIYKKLLEECLKRNDEIVITEYPFKKNWINFFESMINKYSYEAYTINIFSKNFDTLWERLKKRENSNQRHPSHYLDSYDFRNKKDYLPYFEYTYNKHKKEYEKLISNSINLGKVIDIEDIENLDIDNLIKIIINKK